ncbi:MAG TPA: YceI family protein [Steroidobacteraceae bacterium]|nr:YceI family protein [Steroidobacteraceae bacterium]
MNISRSFRMLALALVPMMVIAASGDLDSGNSSVIATFKQEGVKVDAPFKKFSGHITYDAANVAASRATIEVETGTLDLGGEEYNAEVRKKSWFDSATYPKAVFQSTAIKAESATKFVATGTLTIKGKVVNVSVPVNVQVSAASTAYDGSVVISRAAFGIGSPDWNDVIDDKVNVRFHLVASK